MPSFIDHFRLQRTTKDSIVRCALPDEELGTGAITALIGSNNSGKTYTLESLRHALDTTRVNKSQRIVEIEFTGEEKPRFVYLGNNSVHMNKVGQGIDPFVRAERIGHPRDIPNYRPAVQRLLLEVMEEHAEPGFLAKYTEASEAGRKALIGIFPAVKSLFLCRQDHRVILELQQLLRGTLYFRRSTSGDQDLFEFLLAYEAAGPVPFGQWSDGQKMMFLAVCVLMFGGTDVVLIDEIENHLHPERISSFLQLVRAAGVQAIISTHHPHVMMSEHVDRVFFVEQISLPLANPPQQLRLDKPQDVVIPERRFVELRDEFLRIDHLYRLFDQHDQQLLRLASRIRAEVDLGLYEELASAFQHGPARPKTASRPDLQTSQFAAALRTLERESGRALRILDLGAGVGRVARELSKLRAYDNIEWDCWEPNLKTRAALRAELAGSQIRHRVLNDIDEVPDNSVAVALVANVLHELTPEAIGATLEHACRKIIPELGRVIILELYPLLAVEYYAVPYDGADLAEILALSGLTYEMQSYALRGRVIRAHCFVARVERHASVSEIADAVKSKWKQMKLRSIGYWANKKSVRSFDEYKDVLQHMTTVASVSAYEAGLWRTP